MRTATIEIGAWCIARRTVAAEEGETRMLRSIVIGVSCASVLASIGCAEPPESSGPSTCRVDSECGGELLCMDGLCVAPQGEEEGESSESDGGEDEGPQTSPGAPADDDDDSEVEGGDDAPPCGDPMCQGDDALAVCEGGSTVVYDCATVCSDNALGPPAGCGVGDAGVDVCFCEPAAPTCADAGQSCSVNGDCCGFGTTSAGCVAFPDGSVCADKCESNAGCAADCCQPITSGGVATGFGACSDPGLCVQGACGLPQCEYDWCGMASANNCPADWFGDGSCDCGCQYYDIDCG